jgi:hypothetical protein
VGITEKMEMTATMIKKIKKEFRMMMKYEIFPQRLKERPNRIK